MRRPRNSLELGAHGTVVNLVLLVLLTLFMTICGIGAVAGLETIRKHEPADIMSPAWFVAGALGVIVCALIMVALLVNIASNFVSRDRKPRR